MEVLNQLFSTFKVSASVIHNGQYCGRWAVDTSGTSYMSFHVISHGRCFLTVGEREKDIVLQQGDIVLFPRDISHCITNDESFETLTNQTVSESFTQGLKDEGTGLVCGYFAHQHPLMTSLTEHLPDYVLVRHSEASPSGLLLLLNALLEESVNPSKGSELIMSKMSEAILAIVLRDHLPTAQGVLAASLHAKLGPVMSAIHAEPAKKWSVDQLAELSFSSRAAFSELFKEIVGISPMEYVTQWRLSLAYRKLADEKVSTLSAALDCGYDNESSFSKAFKRVMGVSPGAVRAGNAVPLGAN